MPSTTAAAASSAGEGIAVESAAVRLRRKVRLLLLTSIGVVALLVVGGAGSPAEAGGARKTRPRRRGMRTRRLLPRSLFGVATRAGVGVHRGPRKGGAAGGGGFARPVAALLLSTGVVAAWGSAGVLRQVKNRFDIDDAFEDVLGSSSGPNVARLADFSRCGGCRAPLVPLP